MQLHRIRSGTQGKRSWPWVLLGSLAVLALVSTTTLAAAGSPVVGGKRNPGSNQSQAYSAETEIISENGTYGTRQSNKKDGDGGGAIYGCRSAPGTEPCIRANNLKNGRAFEFNSVGGTEAGQILVNGPGVNTKAVPFQTNAAGRVANLNADQVDGQDADTLRASFAVVSSAGTLIRNGGVTTIAVTATGEYRLTLAKDVSQCAYQATIAEGNSSEPPLGLVSAAAGPEKNTVQVFTYDIDGTKAAKPFHVSVDC